MIQRIRCIAARHLTLLAPGVMCEKVQGMELTTDEYKLHTHIGLIYTQPSAHRIIHINKTFTRSLGRLSEQSNARDILFVTNLQPKSGR